MNMHREDHTSASSAAPRARVYSHEVGLQQTTLLVVCIV